MDNIFWIAALLCTTIRLSTEYYYCMLYDYINLIDMAQHTWHPPIPNTHTHRRTHTHRHGQAERDGHPQAKASDPSTDRADGPLGLARLLD